MAVHALSLSRGMIRDAKAPDLPFEAGLAERLKRLPSNAPVVILLHGYKFSPHHPRTDPHRLIFAPETRTSRPRFTSWPRGLGFDADRPSTGLCIGFGWPAADRDHPGHKLGAFDRVYGSAATAGRALARVIEAIAQLAPGRPIDLVAHSLGARVALQCLPHAAPGTVGQVILMGAAEYDGPAAACLRVGAGLRAQVYNITTRENDVFDLLLQRFAPPGNAGERPLSRGLGQHLRNCVDLALDGPQAPQLFARRGIALGPRRPGISHWGFYTRPGTFALYADILRKPHNWTVPALRLEQAMLPPPPQWAWRLIGRGGPPPGAAGALMPSQ